MEGDARVTRAAAAAAAAPPPLPGRRRRPPPAAAAAAAAWPAFPGESNPSGGTGSNKSSPGTCKSPQLVNHATRTKSSCCNCNSCRPFHHQQQQNNAQQQQLQQQQQQQQQQQNQQQQHRRIVYDDVFGGPPRSMASSSSSKEKRPTSPDYEDIFRPKLASSSPSSRAPKSRIAAELPVFDPPEYCSVEVIQSQHPQAPEVAYDDVFGGPLTGPRTRFLKDLLKCSGGNSKWKPGSRSKGTYQSDSSPVSSMQSVSHGNPVYEFDTSDVFGTRRSPSSKSYMGSKPVMTSVSGCSSPFTEPCDASTVNSYTVNSFSPSVSKEAVHLRYDKVYRTVSQAPEADIEVNSPSSSGSFELDFERGSFMNFGKVRRRQRSKTSSMRKTDVKVASPASSNENSPEVETLKVPNIKVRTARECHEETQEASFESEIRSFLEEVIETKQESAGTGNNVKPMVQSPPKQTPNAEMFSENELSELFESEAFMEYSIRDLDGLVAEEYLVSHESLSESSPSSVSVTNSLKTSPSYEAEESDCSVVNIKKAAGRIHSLDKNSMRRPSQKQLHERQEQMEIRQEVLEKIFEKANGGVKLADAFNEEAANSGANEENVSKEQQTESVQARESSSLDNPLQRSKSSREDSGPSSSSSFDFEEIEGETPERRKSRWERHQRATERVAKALAEKIDRDAEHDRLQTEKQRVAELLDDVIKRWAAGKQGNLRALLSTLQYILWPECGWRPVSLMDIIEPVSVRKAYRKATLCVHPDKLQQKGASLEHKYIAEKVFDYLQESWTVFNCEQLL